MKAVVVGSGPAGMFCAYELSKAGIEVTLIEGGRDIESRKCPREGEMGYCVNCPQCQLIQGVGGSGLFSDGKLNLDPEIGGNMLEFMERSEADALVKYVDEIFLSHGAKDGESAPDEKAKDLVMRAKTAGVRFIPISQRHIGSDHLPAVIRSIMDEMKGRGMKLVTETRVDDVVIEDGTTHGVRFDGNTLDADFVVIAPGRAGAHWLGDMCIKLGIHTRHQPIDIGVRVEVPAEIMDWVTSICWDPKFHIQTHTYDDFVRTFCTNPQGFVISESYGDFITVNGHSMRGTKSNNTNFAFLVRVTLTEPVENTTSYGESIAKMATTIGGGKPVIQRFGDLRAGRRSTWE
ncbi:MAG: FAD-dependent oxidoreductase [Candidatus Micrarchaeota archaeon]|nr:FAD-dependent oxidoreductase [Candidatus Micrarchaeota archaeon]